MTKLPVVQDGYVVIPRTRGDCLPELEDRRAGDRCVFRSCRHHLNVAGVTDSCVLDLIDEEIGAAREKVGAVLGVTMQRVAQIEADLLRVIYERVAWSKDWAELLDAYCGEGKSTKHRAAIAELLAKARQLRAARMEGEQAKSGQLSLLGLLVQEQRGAA